MSTKTTYFCDRCGEEFKDRKTLKSMVFKVNETYDDGQYFFRYQDWCVPCLTSVGIVKVEPTGRVMPDKEANKGVTLEDMIREIVRNM